MATIKTFKVSCDIADDHGGTGRYEDGTVTVAGYDGASTADLQTRAEHQTRAHFKAQGVEATNIRATPKRG